MRRSLLALVAVTVLAAGCGTTTETASPEPPDRAGTPGASGSKAGRREKPPANAAPDFTVETFTGQRFSLGEQRGTPVVLNFWESW